MITCERVEKTFHAPAQQQALCWRLDALQVEKGERVLITGPSGCGKTTLLNLLAGLLRPDAGSITVDGVRVDELSIAQADRYRGRHLGLVFQSFQLIPALSVLDNLLLGARYGRKLPPHAARERAEALLAEVGLRERMRLSPGRLSIGEQQRVAIARALINDPPVLLADEPTASLDARNSAIVLDLLFKLCSERQATLVVVSHHAHIADAFDRRIEADGWMRHGEEVSHV